MESAATAVKPSAAMEPTPAAARERGRRCQRQDGEDENQLV
jgi:hypothetical protein